MSTSGVWVSFLTHLCRFRTGATNGRPWTCIRGFVDKKSQLTVLSFFWCLAAHVSMERMMEAANCFHNNNAHLINFLLLRGF
jgi:hypothetical protein